MKDKWDIQYPLFTFLIYNELFLLNWQETSAPTSVYSCRVWKRTATERNSFLKYYLLHVSIKNQHSLKQWTKFKLSFSSITMCMIWNIYNEKPQQGKPLPISQPWCWIKNWKHYPNAKTLLKTPTGSISKNKREKVSVSKSKEKKMYKQQKFELRFNKHY